MDAEALGRLEDGEIDESSQESVASPSLPYKDRTSLSVSNLKDAAGTEGKVDTKKPKSIPESTTRRQETSRAEEEDLIFIDEYEMLCVRGASPVSYSTDWMSPKRTNPSYNNEKPDFHFTQRKKHKKSSRKRTKKHSSSRSASKRMRTSFNESCEDKPKSKRKESKNEPVPEKLNQLCKFYLQDCCIKGPNCEYMHSDFPCKFFYLGLKCADHESTGKCKLSHGGKLSDEMLEALTRHIHTAPANVLGKKFTELRSGMSPCESDKLLHQMQKKLQSSEKLSPGPKEDVVSALRKKFYFLSDAQIVKLQEFNVSKEEDLVSLTLGQLNAIGIDLTKIEALRRSLTVRQDIHMDMDMRTIFPIPTTFSLKKEQTVVKSTDAEETNLALNEDKDNDSSNWLESEEQPLVIDEPELEEEKTEEKEEDDVLIDVVNVQTPSPVYSEPSTSFDVSFDDHSKDENLFTRRYKSEALPMDLNDITSTCNVESKDKVENDSQSNVTSTVSFSHFEGNVCENQNASTSQGPSRILLPLKDDKYNDPKTLGNTSPPNWDTDEDLKMHCYSTDCTQCSGNSEDEASAVVSVGINLELPLPTPNLYNYKPAIEIDAHFTYPAMKYKLHEIYLLECEVNKPPLIEKLIKSNSIDPRLKKYIEKQKNAGIFPHKNYSFFPPTSPPLQGDPRLRRSEEKSPTKQYYNSSPILYGYLQRSLWYRELKSNVKIQINHAVSDLVQALNMFHKDPSPHKIFDFFQIESAGVLLEVMRNVGIFVDVNGKVIELSNYQQLCIPQQTNQTSSYSVVPSPLKPGLLGFAPPGTLVSYSNLRRPSAPTFFPDDQSDFMWQAFGNDCFDCNTSRQSECSFYVRNRNCNNNSMGAALNSKQSPPTKKNFKRHF